MNQEWSSSILLHVTLTELWLAFADLADTVVGAYYTYTYRHTLQTARYVEALTVELDLPENERRAIIKAAFLHDIGKIGISDQLIAKPGPLTSAEYEVVKYHAVIGARIVERMDGLQALVPMIRHHHERWDGQGYPDRLRADEIPRGARVLALADALDAMLAPRPYRSALTLEQAQLEIASCSGSQFDPTVVNAFFNLLTRRGGNLESWTTDQAGGWNNVNCAKWLL